MKKNILIGVLALVAIVLLANTFLGWFSKSDPEKLAAEYQNPKTDEIPLVQYITKDSLVYTKYEPNTGQMAQNNVTKNYYTYAADTLAPALKIAMGDISELQQVKASLEGTIKSLKAEVSKEKVRSVFYKDKYFSAVTKTDSLGNSSMDYNYNAQLDIVTHKKRKNIFSRETQEVAITSPDKNLKINGVEHFKKELSLSTEKWGIGVQVGYYYDPQSNRIMPALGVGLSYNPIRF